MPRISMSGQERSRHDWKEIQNMIMENLFDPLPSEEERLNKEIKDLIEEAKKNVREADRRDND